METGRNYANGIFNGEKLRESASKRSIVREQEGRKERKRKHMVANGAPYHERDHITAIVYEIRRASNGSEPRSSTICLVSRLTKTYQKQHHENGYESCG